MDSAIFLDRDGTINRLAPPHHYITDPQDFVFLPETLDALAFLAKNSGRKIVIVTNQPCIGKELVTAQQIGRLHEWMVDQIERGGGRVDAVYVCPHVHEDNCACRKPKPGLLLRAAKDLDIIIENSVLVGDTKHDLRAAWSAGITACYAVMTGMPLRELPMMPLHPYDTYATLLDAAKAIVRTEHERQ